MELIQENDTFAIDGVKVSRGLFGVPNGKGVTATGALFRRFIMNLVPINSYLHELIGETKAFPNMAQWAHFVHADEIDLLFSEDQKASFYLYELPAAWRPFYVFRWRAPG